MPAPANPFQHVNAQQDLEISAPTWNAMLDAAAANQNGGRGDRGQRPEADDHSGTIVKVRNDSGVAVDQYGVLVIDEPVFLPSDSETAFKTFLVLSCDIPASSGTADDAKFVILLEPLADGQIGLAKISGVVQVQVEMIDEEHNFADVADGEDEYLESRETGSAQILWRAGGSGIQWCVVRLSNEAVASAGATIPAGVAWDYAGNTVPDGWLLCDGSSVLRADYPDLFTAIGVLWGSVDGTHFTLPDSDGKTVRGFGTSPFNVVGATGGIEAVSVKHTHQGFCVSTEAYGTFFTVSWDWTQTTNQSLDNWNGTASGTVAIPTGANHQFDNRGPWQCMKRIIKT